MREPTLRAMEILLIEDNPGDVRLVVEGLGQGRVRHHLSVARNGLEALAFLKRQGPYALAPRPDLIVLDLNLPRKGGREVLAEIKADPAMRAMPVVVFSGSEMDADVAAAYDLRANCYIVKPVNLDEFLAAVRGIEEFWLSTAALPPQPS